MTEFLFLGTCARDYSSRLGGECRDRFDNDARRSSGALIDGKYLIDCGHHVPDALRIACVDCSKITDLFVTHTHDDHFFPENVAKLPELCGHTLNLWVRAGAELPEFPGFNVIRTELGSEYTVREGFTLRSLPANHVPTVSPQHFLFEIDGKTIFYGCDGAWMMYDTYWALRNRHLDLCVLDATCGDYEGDYRAGEHNSIPMLRTLLPSLRTERAVDDHTLVYLSHLAPSLHKSHAETVEIVKNDGMRVAYDGLKIVL